MRTLVVTEVAQELPGLTPFMPNYTVVAVNATAASVTLQSSDVVGSGYATLATIAAGKSAEVTLNKAFVKLSAAGSLILLGN